MRRVFIISAAVHVAFMVLLPIVPNLGTPEPLAMEVYAVELVDLPAPEPAAEEPVQEAEPEPETTPVEPEPEPEEKPIPEEPVQRPIRKIVPPPPKRVEKSLEERIADRMREQDANRKEEPPKEEAPAPRPPSGSTKISAGKVVADYYLTMLQGKITRNWKQPSARFTGGETPTARISFTVLQDGSITDLRVSRSSNWPTVDESAVQAVRVSAPFAELPSTYLGDRLDVTIDFTVKQ
jgi:protein TonB